MEADQSREGTAMKRAEPHKENQWLRKLVGEWATEGEAEMGPGQPVSPFKGTETVRPLARRRVEMTATPANRPR